MAKYTLTVVIEFSEGNQKSAGVTGDAIVDAIRDNVLATDAGERVVTYELDSAPPDAA